MNTNRRKFLKKAALGTSGLLILSCSRTARTYEANSKMNLAVVGLNYGRFHLERVSESKQNLVAICDINLKKMDAVADRRGARREQDFRLMKGARRFQDFRQMIEEMGSQLDGIFIATPHHTLTTIAAEAMKAGKHVYCQKPLSHDIGEARFIRQLALKHKGIITQMGNQGVATDAFRSTLERVQQGDIGEVREAHVWFTFPGFGIDPWHNEIVNKPDYINWDVFQGPTPNRSYHPEYVGNWRKWRAYGTGWLGGGGAHAFHMAFRGLDVGALWKGGEGSMKPIKVKAEVPVISSVGYPEWEHVTFDIPARDSLPPARIHWHIGSEEHLKERGILQKLEKHAGTSLDWKYGWTPTSGSMLIGSKGLAHTNAHNSLCKLLPEKDFPNQGLRPKVIRPAHKTLPITEANARSGAGHEWIEGCKNGQQPLSNFISVSPIIEMLMLGNIATMTGQSLDFDPVSGSIINNAEADKYIRPARRKGWEL